MRAKQLLFMTFLAGTLTIGQPLFADPDRLTSAEWSGMPEYQKIEFVTMAMDELKAKDVPLIKTPTEYVREIDGVYSKKPDLPAMAVSELLPSLVYAKEPASREMIDKLIKKKELNKIEPL